MMVLLMVLIMVVMIVLLMVVLVMLVVIMVVVTIVSMLALLTTAIMFSKYDLSPCNKPFPSVETNGVDIFGIF